MHRTRQEAAASFVSFLSCSIMTRRLERLSVWLVGWCWLPDQERVWKRPSTGATKTSSHFSASFHHQPTLSRPLLCIHALIRTAHSTVPSTYSTACTCVYGTSTYPQRSQLPPSLLSLGTLPRGFSRASQFGALSSLYVYPTCPSTQQPPSSTQPVTLLSLPTHAIYHETDFLSSFDSRTYDALTHDDTHPLSLLSNI